MKGWKTTTADVISFQTRVILFVLILGISIGTKLYRTVLTNMYVSQIKQASVDRDLGFQILTGSSRLNLYVTIDFETELFSPDSNQLV